MLERPIGKTEIARRQLLAALHIHWYLKEPLAVYCLAASAWNVTNDLLKRVGKLRVVEQLMQIHNLSEKDAGLLIRSSWNFAKHADSDPHAETVDYSDEDCDSVLEAACIDFSILTRRAPAAVQIFLIWYSAIYPEKTGVFMRHEADQIFPNLSSVQRKHQVHAARQAVVEWTHRLSGNLGTDLTDNWRWVELRNTLGLGNS